MVLVGLRHGTCCAFLGADDDLRYLVNRLRVVWPDVQLHVRADSGFGVPVMFLRPAGANDSVIHAHGREAERLMCHRAEYGVCDELDLIYTFGICLNSRLKRASDALLSQAVEQYAQTGIKQRLFQQVRYRAERWEHARCVIIKAECQAQGTNRRAVVTNRPEAVLFPAATYDEYVQRGESENRDKEFKVGMKADRLSDHRFLANFFRLYLHAAALNLLTRLRRQVARKPTPGSQGISDAVPSPALSGRSRKTLFNRRREADPLGEGPPATWRTRLIKVVAEVFVRARRIVVRVSSHWPHLPHLADVAREVLALHPD